MKIFALLLCCTVAFATSMTEEASPIVHTPLGSYKGKTFVSASGKTIYAYTNISYATVPTGAYKFQAATPVQAHEGIYDATGQGPACAVPFAQGQGYSFDCLTMNIFSPGIPSESSSHPVIVVFATSEPYEPFGPASGLGPHYAFAHDAVVVVFNYRAGVTGFLATGNEYAPGNAGLKDQVLALQYVHNNIQQFGGDNSKVAIFSSGSGSQSVSFHLIAPSSQNYHAAIIASNAAQTHYALPTHQQAIAKSFAEYIGCPSDFGESMFQCLGGKSAEEVVAVYPQLAAEYGQAALFAPVIESADAAGAFLTIQPSAAFSEGKFSKVPVIMGSAKDGFANYIVEYQEQAEKGNTTAYNMYYTNWEQMAPKLLNYESGTPKSSEISDDLKNRYFGGKPFGPGSYYQFTKIITDFLSLYPNYKVAQTYSKYAPLYVFDYQYESAKPYKPFSNGTSAGIHNYDLVNLLFQTAKYPDHTPQDAEYADTFYGYLINLIDGTPTPASSSFKWEPYTLTNPQYAEFSNAQSVMKPNYPHLQEMQKIEGLFATSSNKV